MSSSLPLANPDDPNLSAAAEGSLARCRLDPEWLPTVIRLATGEIPASTLHCCGSGCRPCVADLVRCTRMTLESLQGNADGGEGAVGAGGAAQGRAGRRLFEALDTGLARRLARAALRRLGGRR